MYYIQDLISLIGDTDLSKQEVEVLNKFTDEKVGFKKPSGYDFFSDINFKLAIRNLKEHNLMQRYKDLVYKHFSDNIDEFSNQMDIEL